MERDFCKPILGGNFFKSFDLKKATNITIFERFCLMFVKEKYSYDEIDNTTLVYKTFKGKMYILNHFINPPKTFNCRHKFNYK